jgi:probable rRNA maturation factor
MIRKYSENLVITNETKGKLPRLPFKRLKKKILGELYVLRIVFIGDRRSRALNQTYRRRNKPTNILSFPINKKEGELYIDLKQVKRETKLFGRSLQNLTGFLVIHGMFHLKGLAHGSKMESKEKAVRALFHI